MKPPAAVDGCPTRRTVLATVAVGVSGTVAGCLDDDRDGPEPIALTEGQACDHCNMRIEMHPGPVGQAFYGADAPASLSDDREDGVTWFCSSACTYRFVHEQAEQGYEPVVSYGTDYSDVEYELREESGTSVISAHREPDAFAALRALTFVVDSDIEGAMGGSLIGFSDPDDAASFAGEHGGELFEHDEVTREVVAALGM